MSSGWFDCTEHSLSTSLQGKQGVQGAYFISLMQCVDDIYGVPKWPMPITTSLQPVAGVNYE